MTDMVIATWLMGLNRAELTAVKKAVRCLQRVGIAQDAALTLIHNGHPKTVYPLAPPQIRSAVR